MKILITGSDSFIGKNLKAELINRKFEHIIEYNDYSDAENLGKCIDESDFIFHLMTVYRSDNDELFELVNVDVTRQIVDFIGDSPKPLLLLSSMQSGNESNYGKSKQKAEEIVKQRLFDNGKKAYIFRLPHEFGKWCPPNLNSVVATFCHNIANGFEISINNYDAPLSLVYIDDIVTNFIDTIESNDKSLYRAFDCEYNITVGQLANILRSFKQFRHELSIPDLSDTLVKRLYSTYLSYLATDDFSASTETHVDQRGSFTELLHFGDNGQVSVNTIKPGITKGNHWHHTKNEKFVVVKGSGVIEFRKIGEVVRIEYPVCEDKIQVVDIPPGYTHSITNIGEDDLVVIIWANELFDKQNPDTYFEEV